MPGLIRKLSIFAAVDGLILEAHNVQDNYRAFQIAYKTKEIRTISQSEVVRYKNETKLECYGILGVFSLASDSFLIVINRREQVAQFFNKPIYVITDIFLLPLSSQNEARKVINLEHKSRNDTQSPKDTDFSDSDLEDGKSQHSSEDVIASPAEEIRPSHVHSSSSTSIAKDVIANQGRYGRFASQWFLKQGWGVGIAANQTTKPLNFLSTGQKSDSTTEEKEEVSSHSEVPKIADEHVTKADSRKNAATTGVESIKSMLPKILRSTRQILSSRSFYFSYDINLTKRMSLSQGKLQPPSSHTTDPLYFWNRNLGEPLLNAEYEDFIIPVLQGFVGQRAFAVQKNESEKSRSTSIIAANPDTETIEETLSQTTKPTETEHVTEAFLLTLISRRSVKRSGLRYLRRGIDDEGNCANSVETEQILSSPSFDPAKPIRSFVQTRGSIPLYFSQTPYSFKPAPVLHHPPSVNEAAMKKHFQDLRNRYGQVQVAVLVDKHGGERIIGETFEKTVKSISDSDEPSSLSFEWFDFHSECRGMKFENVERLVQELEDKIEEFGETIIRNDMVEQKQTGIIRTNCMDCLDRTNVAQSAFGQYILQRELNFEGFDIDLLHDNETTWFNNLWADNGDAISRQYASTAALKGDFTRTRKRAYRGALNDLSLTLTRYYNNMVNDFFSQALIDTLLGNVTWEVWLDFESNMMSVDPGISIEKVRETAIENCLKVVIQDDKEDLLHGWTMLVPAQENTLRTTPFEEAVVLLTDQSLYCCRFDWTTEKVASFEKVDLRSISKIRYGVYITSTLSDRQMDEGTNVGLAVVYSPGRENIIRTNTRSLQNQISPPEAQNQGIDGGTGIVSWLSTRAQSTTRTLALKIITQTSDLDRGPSKHAQSAISIAEHRCDEIRRAMVGSDSKPEDQAHDLVERGDIISLAEAKKRTGYFEQIGHTIRKLVWT